MQDKRNEIIGALAMAEKVYAALRGAAVPGATEQALDLAVRQAAAGHAVQYDLLSGPRTALVEGGATARVLQRGDPVLLDLCLQQGDHWCDVCRTYFLGEADPAVRQAYAAVYECQLLLAGHVRAGARASNLHAVAQAYLAQRGMAGWTRHHMGHGIGHAPFQPPVLLPESGDVLAAGDVVTVEIGVYDGSAFGIRLENDYWVTDTGAQNLWREPETLHAVTLPWPDGGAGA